MAEAARGKGPGSSSGSGSRLRRWFRRCRVLAWLALLGLVLTFLYVNRVGLPSVVKNRLVAALRARGVDVEFNRLRWRWYQGIVAEGVWLSGGKAEPEFQAAEVAISLNWGALLRREVEVSSAEVIDGRIRLRLPEADGGVVQDGGVTVDKISARVRFPANERWDLEEFTASYRGSVLHARGGLKNAGALSGIGKGSSGKGPGVGRGKGIPLWVAPVRHFAETWKRIAWAEPPELWLRVEGDGKDPSDLVVDLRGEASGARTPWGTLQRVSVEGSVRRASGSEERIRTRVAVTVQDGQTPWGQVEEGKLETRWLHSSGGVLAPDEVSAELTAKRARSGGTALETLRMNYAGAPDRGFADGWRSKLTVDARELQTEYGRSRSNLLTAEFVQSWTNWGVMEGRARLELGAFEAQGFEAQGLEVKGRLVRNGGGSGEGATAVPLSEFAVSPMGWKFGIEGECRATEASYAGLRVTELRVGAGWMAPLLEVRRLDAHVRDGGTLHLEGGKYDASRREFAAGIRSDLAASVFEGWLGAREADWVRQVSWQSPPRLEGDVRVTLPEGKPSDAGWVDRLLRGLVARVAFASPPLSIGGLDLRGVNVAVECADGEIVVKEIGVRRPEGGLRVGGRYTLATQRLEAWMENEFDPTVLRPLAGEGFQRVLDLFRFHEPPVASVKVWCSGNRLENLGIAGSLRMTDFVFREDAFDSLVGGFVYTNGWLVATNVHAQSGEHWVDVPAVGYRMSDNRVFLTNATTFIEPMRVAVLIGGDVPKTIEAYRFLEAPRATVNGHVPVVGSTDTAAMRFDVEGGPFEYWRFQLPQVSASVRWEGLEVTVTNLAGAFYGGTITGGLHLDVPHGLAPILQLDMEVTEAHLRDFLRDVVKATNNISGTLSTRLRVTRADTSDWGSWQGYGNFTMREGLLWEFPMLGIFSDVLNGVAPGVGKSKASAAKAHFRIVDSVIHTEDLEINSPPVRLQYAGTVDFDGRVQAKVEAEMLRGTPLVGRLLSFALSPLSKVFVFRVTGTLWDPKAEPLYLPKFLTPILRPIRTLRSIIEGDGCQRAVKTSQWWAIQNQPVLR